MKNFLNIVLVFSLSTFILCGIMMPILHAIDFFYDIDNIKEGCLTGMLIGMCVTTPIGTYNYFSGGSPTINLPNAGRVKEGQKPKPSCGSCKSKKK